jgi:hypothetical protein
MEKRWSDSWIDEHHRTTGADGPQGQDERRWAGADREQHPFTGTEAIFMEMPGSSIYTFDQFPVCDGPSWSQPAWAP